MLGLVSPKNILFRESGDFPISFFNRVRHGVLEVVFQEVLVINKGMLSNNMKPLFRMLNDTLAHIH